MPKSKLASYFVQKSIQITSRKLPVRLKRLYEQQDGNEFVVMCSFNSVLHHHLYSTCRESQKQFIGTTYSADEDYQTLSQTLTHYNCLLVISNVNFGTTNSSSRVVVGLSHTETLLL